VPPEPPTEDLRGFEAISGEASSEFADADQGSNWPELGSCRELLAGAAHGLTRSPMRVITTPLRQFSVRWLNFGSRW
jgi:hypothetical protein